MNTAAKCPYTAMHGAKSNPLGTTGVAHGVGCDLLIVRMPG